jgi:purine-binding chemotaxis protein CheW
MEKEISHEKTHQFVSFRLGNEEFGVDILKVREIVRLQKIARVPQTPEFVEGVINLRGNIIPIINLRNKFGLEEIERDNNTRIIVFNVEGKIIGVIVDRVEQVLRLAEDLIELPPEIGTGKMQEYIKGVGKIDEGLLILLHIEKILTNEEMFQLKELDKIKNVINKKHKEEKK